MRNRPAVTPIVSVTMIDQNPHRVVGAKVRCAIYTRKSSEEGLEQDFNSLDAQREACEAYVAFWCGLIRSAIACSRNGNLTVEEVAREEDLVPSYVTRLLRLTFLAPDIITSIIAGRQPPELTARKLMADTRMPLDWREQRIQLGFA